MSESILTHEQKVEELLKIIASCSVATFAFNVSQIPDSNVTVKANSQDMANRLAEALDELL